MTWKKRVAKEWLWLICTVAGVVLGWNTFLFMFEGVSAVKEYWEALFDSRHYGHDTMVLITAIPIALIYFIRLTVWSIKQARKKNSIKTN